MQNEAVVMCSYVEKKLCDSEHSKLYKSQQQESIIIFCRYSWDFGVTLDLTTVRSSIRQPAKPWSHHTFATPAVSAPAARQSLSQPTQKAGRVSKSHKGYLKPGSR